VSKIEVNTSAHFAIFITPKNLITADRSKIT
jgi:hypothetical protein